MSLPQTWDQALEKSVLWRDRSDQLGTGVPSPSGDGVLHEADTADAAHISLVGAKHQIVADIGTIPRVGGQGGIGYSAASSSQVAFVYYPDINGGQQQNRWTLYLWDRVTAHLQSVRSSPVDSKGQPLSGGYVVPVLTGKYLYWVEASVDAVGYSATGVGSRLVQYDLATGQSRTLYNGLVDVALPYRSMVLFTAVPAGPPQGPNPTDSFGRSEIVRAIDQDSGREVPPPSGITAGVDRAQSLTTNGSLIAWNTAGGALRMWDPKTGLSTDVVPDFEHRPAAIAQMDAPYRPQFLGAYLVWNSTQTYVLDTRNFSYVAITKHHGDESTAGNYLAVWDYSAAAVAPPGSPLNYVQRLINLSVLPPLPACR